MQDEEFLSNMLNNNSELDSLKGKLQLYDVSYWWLLMYMGLCTYTKAYTSYAVIYDKRKDARIMLYIH